ncbi:hypothetical protein IE53DRAFT_373194 [Violaceomyces palustris]|uniref:Uncharacterized protein n=1 Tax=Violaceomyces palustris TaxID=1673888 RepID=A0ACD0P4V7_9BASI|nr:hypothetical protein IE53DRAFT_373194 [Violaceomyces palustris]
MDRRLSNGSSGRHPLHRGPLFKVLHALLFCNGHPSLCDKAYPDVVYMGTHNSYAYGNGLSDNQYRNITQQLEDGIRLLQSQGHPFYEPSSQSPSGISLCHTSCYLQNGGFLEEWLGNVTAWLESNPDEVLTLLVTNPDGVPVSMWKKAFEFHHLDQISFVPPPGTTFMRRQDWPTLGEMIESGTRLVTFLDYGADRNQAEFLLSEFQSIWENAYDQLSVPFSCEVDRGSTRRGKMGLLNHVRDVSYAGISIPDKASLNQTNSANSPSESGGILSNFENCTRLSQGVRPTFILTDFYNVPERGGVFEAASVLNQVPLETYPGSSTKSGAARSGGVSSLVILSTLIGV